MRRQLLCRAWNQRSSTGEPAAAVRIAAKVHYGDKTPVSLVEATAVVPAPEKPPPDQPRHDDHDGAVVERVGRSLAPKNTRPPMSVDDALHQMSRPDCRSLLVSHEPSVAHAGTPTTTA